MDTTRRPRRLDRPPDPLVAARPTATIGRSPVAPARPARRARATSRREA